MSRKQAGSVPVRLAVHVDAARACDRDGNHLEAVRHYEAALRAMRDPTEARLAPSLLRWAGSCHRARGDRAAAFDSYRASLTVARLQSGRGDIAHALNWLGIIRQDEGRLEAADRLFRHARRHGRLAGDERMVAMVEQNLGINCNIRGDLPAALRHYRRSLACYRRLEEPRFIAQVLNVLGMLYTDLGRWPAAGRAFRRSARLCAALGDIHTHIMVEVNRAELLSIRGRIGGARGACDRAHRLALQLGHEPALGEVFRWYGAIHRQAGEVAESEQSLQLALRIARAYRIPLLEAESLHELALLCRDQGHDREALRALLAARRLFKDLQAQRDFAELGRRLADLESQFLAVVQEWAESIESKDHYTHGHCNRVAEYSTTLARHFGFHEDTIRWFRMGAYLHDVGKTVVPIEILNKPGRLTPEEFTVMKSHTVAGDAIVAELQFPWDIRPMVRSHHEYWDGSGYPDGLRAEAIPLAARILCVVDVFDALTTTRPYRKAFSVTEALAIMEPTAGTQFDPAVFALFRRLLDADAFRELDRP